MTDKIPEVVAESVDAPVAAETGSASGAGRRVRVEEVEQLVRDIPGVTDCRIIVNDWGGVEEIHVLALADKSPKIVARDVESAMAARFRLRVDHKKISVAQVVDPSARLRGDVRLRIRSHQTVANLEREIARVEVLLASGSSSQGDPEIIYEGAAEGPLLRRSTVRLVAAAALDAVRQALPGGHLFELEEIKSTEMRDHKVIVALVTHHAGQEGDHLLTGSAVVLDDEATAVIRAVLDAVNRSVAYHGRRSGSDAHS